MKKLLIVIIILISLYLLVCGIAYIFQNKIIFFPQGGSSAPPEELSISEIWVPTSDGQQLHAWWMPVDSAKYTVLFFHGNAGNISRGEKRMQLFHEMGFNALTVDYRGYGISTGKIKNENDIYEDARASWDYLKNTLGVPEDKIIIWGWSLGGAVAVNLAQSKRCHTLVMESTFFSLYDMAKKTYGFLPLRWLLNFNFSSGEKLSKVECPVLFIHSRQDETVPFSQGRKLFDKFSGNKQFIEISGDHNHGIFDSKNKLIKEALPFLTLDYLY